ncbi:MAG: FHA domain-containing protein [Lachnospiraceae bacterium]|nr:FHA domain-containing protein [Lachnospiraceae bacterium]
MGNISGAAGRKKSVASRHIYYMNDRWEPVPKERATLCEIVEFDEEGRLADSVIKHCGPGASLKGIYRTSGLIIGTGGCFQGRREETPPAVWTVVGRASSANIRIIGKGSESVSRQHCSIRYIHKKNNFEVVDTSSNGTFVNGKRLKRGLVSLVPCGVELALGDGWNRLRLDRVYV